MKLERQPTQISRWERDISEPTLMDLLIMSHVLNVSRPELLGDLETNRKANP